jgi:hypothetical protein
VLQCGRVQVQRRAVAAEVDGDGGVAEALVEDGRQEMLAGVLLQ